MNIQWFLFPFISVFFGADSEFEIRFLGSPLVSVYIYTQNKIFNSSIIFFIPLLSKQINSLI